MPLLAQENIIDTNTLAQTNAYWNKSRINHPWSVGYTSELIQAETFMTLDDWVTFYFYSGDVRDIIIADIEDEEELQLMSSIEVIDHATHRIRELPKYKASLNYQHGRSWTAVLAKSQYLQSYLKDRKIEIPLRECIRIFLQRVIIDTWNGHAREENTISNLQESNPQLEFIASTSWEDFNYGIDYWIRDHGQLIGAIQIKPQSYRKDTPYILKAKAANHRKYQRFTKRYHAPVWTILSKINGEIVDDGGFKIL